MYKLLTILVFFSYSALAQVDADLPQSPQTEPAKASTFFEYLPCEERVFETIAGWGVTADWTPLVGPKGVKSPTKEVGAWVKVILENEQEVKLLKVSPYTITSANFKAPHCGVQLKTARRMQSMSEGFSDEKLKKILEKSKERSTAGIIYAWSPRMILSSRGSKEASEIAKKLQLDFHVVADSASSNDIKVDKQTLNNSVELKERGMEIHFPSLIFYKNGSLLGHVRPGYDAPDRLETVLKEKMNENN